MRTWYEEGANLTTLLPHLSVYLGHVSPEETYWYLTATPELLGGGRVMMIAVLIEQQVRETLNWPFASALSAVLLIATFAVYALAQRFTRTAVQP